MVTHVVRIIMVIMASRDMIMLCTNMTTTHAVINALTTVGAKAMNTASLMVHIGVSYGRNTMDIMQIVMDSIAIGNTIKSVIVGKNRAAHFRTQYSKKIT